MNNGRKGGQLAARLWDITFYGAGLSVLWPLFAPVALLILMSDGRDVFFRQKRIGTSGKPFRIVKFHTIRSEADGADDHCQRRSAHYEGRSLAAAAVSNPAAHYRSVILPEKVRLILQYQRSRSLARDLKLRG